MKLLKVRVKSVVRATSDYYISETEYDAGSDTLTVYNGIGVAYGLLVKRENILSIHPV
jgi:hypothetical protein